MGDGVGVCSLEVRAKTPLPLPPPHSRSPCLLHQRSVRAFAPLLAPHECFSGGIFRDGLLCKWHLSCDLPGEREGGREGSERGNEKERQDGGRGRTDDSLSRSALSHLQLSFQPAAPFLFLRGWSGVHSHMSKCPPPTLLPASCPSLCKSGARLALFLAWMTRYHMKLLTRALILDLLRAQGKHQAGSHQSLAHTHAHARRHAHTHSQKVCHTVLAVM